ncbi:MAG: hypothetical protein C5B53_09270 [Candidatus Melainabacteria bacterium]|nr:MAG: hypothetical protein C5B53_09270 [Candidatus Melainabacteria bacterium]
MKGLIGLTAFTLLLSTAGAYAQGASTTVEQSSETEPVYRKMQVEVTPVQKEVQVEKEIQEVPVPVPVPAQESKSSSSSSSSFSSRTIEKKIQPKSTIRHRTRTMGYRAPCAKRKLSMSTSKKSQSTAPSEKVLEHSENYERQQSSSSSSE